MALGTSFTQVTKSGLSSTSAYDTGHINSSGIITATKFVGTLEGNVTSDDWTNTATGISTTINVGIGTTNAAAKLTVGGSGVNSILLGSTDASGVSIGLDGDSNGDGSGSDYALIQHNNSGELKILNDNPSGSGPIIFGTPAEKMRLLASGQLNVGSNIKLGTAGIVTATTFSGALSGTASTATSITITDESSDTLTFPLFVTGSVSGGLVQTANLAPQAGSNFYFNSSTGALSATSFSGSGASLTSLPAANLTGTLPAISGANLTSLPTQVTITGNSNNRVITGGSGVNLNGSANFTYDGNEVAIYASTDDTDCILNLVGKTPSGGVGQAGRTAIIAESTSTSNGQSSMHLRTRNTSNAQHIAMTLDGSQRVGIGTSLPQTKLHLCDTNAVIRLDQRSNTTQGLEWYSASGSKSATIGWGNGNANLEFKNFRQDSQPLGPYGNIDFFTGNSTSPPLVARMQVTGEVGVNTTNPQLRLHVGGSMGCGGWGATAGGLWVNGQQYIESADFRLTSGENPSTHQGDDLILTARYNTNTSLISADNTGTGGGTRITFTKNCYVLVCMSQDADGNTDSGYWSVTLKRDGSIIGYHLMRKTTEWDMFTFQQSTYVAANSYLTINWHGTGGWTSADSNSWSHYTFLVWQRT